MPAVYASRVSAPGFWDVAAAAGKRALVLDAALAFGGEGTPGARVLSGLGLPDATGQMNGHWSIYTTEETELQRPPQGTPTRSGTGRVCRVDERGGQVTTRLYGPRDFTLVQAVVDELAELEPRPAPGDRELEERITAMQGTLSEQPKVAVDMTFERRGAALAITVDGVTHEAAAGAWTGWFRPVFRLSDGTELRALTRARVLSTGDVLSVYIDPLHIDPEAPPAWQPISSPASFSADLARWSGGPYETLRWACLTNQMKDRSLPVEVFLEDVEFTMRWRERLTTTCLARDDWELLFSVFSTVDRVQHVMYRHADVGHPRHDATEAAREVTYFGRPTALRDVLDATYVQMDRIVGEVLATLAPEDQLLLCADHGFTSFRHGFHVNNWLAREGYLGARRRGGGGPRSNLMTDVDWTRTRAYSLGLGMIYLNLRGREPQGIVPKRQAQALLEELRAKLLEVTDDSDGAPRRVVLDAVIMRDLYPGGEVPWGTLEWPCADLMLGLAEYYRVSWDTVSGDVRYVRDPRTGQASLAPNFSPNNSPWSGDHASTSPSVVTGAFFSRRAVTVPADGVSVLHIAPTVLDALGVAAPDTMDLAPLR